MNLKTVSLIVSLVALLYIIATLFTEKEQFQASIHLAIWMQSYHSSILDFFMAFCSFLGYSLLVLVLAVYTFIEPNKFLAHKITFFCISTGFLNGVLKLLYSSPRPWYVDEKVLVTQCLETDFGRPSGHSMFSLYVGIMFYRSYIYHSGEELIQAPETEFLTSSPLSPKNNIFGPSDTKKKLIFMLYVLAIILVGVSRVYRGAHSFDQVLLGWSYAILCFNLTVYWLEKPVEKLFSSYYENWDYNFKRHLLVLILTFFVCLSLPIVIFIVKEGTLDLQPWVKLIKSKCGVEDKNKILIANSLYTTAFGALSFGILFGILFGSRNVLSRRSVESHSCKKIGIKLIIALLMVGLFGLIGYVIPVADNPYVIYILKRSLLLFLVGFFMLAILPRIYHKLKLEIEELELAGQTAHVNTEPGDSELAIQAGIIEDNF